MPDPVDVKGQTGGAGDGGPSPAEIEIQKRLEKIESGVQSGQMLQRMLSDPDIQKVIQAKTQGKKIQVELEDETPSRPASTNQKSDLDDDDLDLLTNSQFEKRILGKLEELLGSKMESFVGAKIKPVEELMQTQSAQIERAQFEKNLAELKARRGEDEVQKYGGKMIEVEAQIRQNGLSLDDLFFLAKKGDLETELTRLQVSSERPTGFVMRNIPKPEVIRQGKQGFASMLSEAFGKSMKG
jgi:hypothetical protein